MSSSSATMGGMRANYQNQGVEGYYSAHGSNYRNPHNAGVKKVLNAFLDAYWSQRHNKRASPRPPPENAPSRLCVFDLAAGSGEVTEAVLAWSKSRWSAPPHTEPSSAAAISSPSSSRAFIPAAAKKSTSKDLRQCPRPSLDVVAADPFTGEAYTRHTGLSCAPLSFADLAQDQYPEPSSSRTNENENDDDDDVLYDLTICSFALHLLTNPSELWALLQTLQRRTQHLVVVAPHKLPHIKDGWGFVRVDPRTLADVDVGGQAEIGGEKGDGAEIVLDRVRLRVWRSIMT